MAVANRGRQNCISSCTHVCDPEVVAKLLTLSDSRTRLAVKTSCNQLLIGQ